MEHTEHVSHAHAVHEGGGKKEVVRITIYLSIITLVELGLGFMMKDWPEDSGKRHFVKGVIMILMLWKAFYIVGYFMHLRHELRNLIMTITVPLLLFVWFIIAFLADGNSYKNLRNTYDRHHYESSKEKAPAENHEEHEGKKAAE
jgi:cytochrome c oxidase subunit IV